ncbi:MAG: DNA starvation/stationary phase protection protein [Flavobacteriaceae bacterium]|nr:DNA starvation/stationary phase protection protein [Flavobacteriaceae bacterium]
MSTTIIGLDVKKSEQLANKLNILLANFQVYYQNLRGLHWNIKGKSFFELHVKFEELYSDTQEKVDVIAERVLTLQEQPLHTFEDYIRRSSVKVAKNITNDVKAVEVVVTSLAALIKIERELLDLSAAAEDEGTNALMSDFIAEQEKTIWMMNAWLG